MKKLLLTTLLLTNSAYALDCRQIANSAQPTSDQEVRVSLRCLPNEELLGITCNVEDLNSDGEGFGAGFARYVGDRGVCVFYPIPDNIAAIAEEEEVSIPEVYGRVLARAKCCK